MHQQGSFRVDPLVKSAGEVGPKNHFSPNHMAKRATEAESGGEEARRKGEKALNLCLSEQK